MYGRTSCKYCNPVDLEKPEQIRHRQVTGTEKTNLKNKKYTGNVKLETVTAVLYSLKPTPTDKNLTAKLHIYTDSYYNKVEGSDYSFDDKNSNF